MRLLLVTRANKKRWWEKGNYYYRCENVEGNTQSAEKKEAESGWRFSKRREWNGRLYVNGAVCRPQLALE
jgi:hypothetical protein